MVEHFSNAPVYDSVLFVDTGFKAESAFVFARRGRQEAIDASGEVKVAKAFVRPRMECWRASVE